MQNNTLAKVFDAFSSSLFDELATIRRLRGGEVDQVSHACTSEKAYTHRMR